MESLLQQYFNFSDFIEKLKKMERFKGQFYWKDYPQLKRYESVADHSWRLGVLVLLFHNKLSKSFDLEKALKMALLHDLPETIAGDASPLGKEGAGKDSHAFNESVAQKKQVEETTAAEKLFGILPKEKSNELFEIWKEFDQQESFEARVVKSLDRIEAMLQVLEYRQGHMFPEHLDFTINYGSKGSGTDPIIGEFAKFIAEQMKNKFKEFK